jgi:MATE family multidrug resistance protein
MGINQLATIEILLIIFSLSSYSLDAFAHSAETLVGNSIGAKNKRGLFLTIKHSTELAFLFSLIIGLFLYCFGYFIISVFTDIQILRKLTNELWMLVVITPFISMLAFQLDGVFIGATLAKEMRNSIIMASLIFYLTLEFIVGTNLNLKNLYSCFLFFLILRGFILSLYLQRVFNLIKL